MFAFHQKLVFAVALTTCVLIAGYAEAQLFPRRGNPPIQPVQPVPVQPIPGQAVPAQPAQQPTPPAQDNAAVNSAVQPIPGGAPGTMAAQGGVQGRLIHGRGLIGMNIWGPNQQQVGTIQDFIVDSQQGGCPTIYFAVAPQIAGWNEGYVIVPFNAFQIGHDNGLRGDRFVLNINADGLRRAPHLAVDKWNSGQDRQFLTDSRQFFQRTERTAARPETGGNREERPQLPNGQQRPDEGNRQRDQQPDRGQQQPRADEHPQAPAGQPTPAARQDTERRPDAARQSQPENERGAAPPAPAPDRDKRENNR